MSLRPAFPVLDRLAYLNAGTDGPVPAAAQAAAAAALEAQTQVGRSSEHFEARIAEQARLRALYAGVAGCDPSEVALTNSTSEGLSKVLSGMELGPGDEVLTSDQEHPGLIGPLLAVAERGAAVRTGPLGSLASAVTAATTVVACSHVGWLSGEVADPALRDADVPVVYDGAQGAGAIPVDVRALRCAAYAASGQKWLCGADGTGFLYVAPDFMPRVRAYGPAYFSFADPAAAALHEDARRHDTASLGRESVAFSLAAAELLAAHGWERVHRHGTALAARLADALRESGRTVGPRGDTTLVAWESPDAEAEAARLSAAGVVLRHLPRTPYVRASVGAWNDDSDLDRLLSALPSER